MPQNESTPAPEAPPAWPKVQIAVGMNGIALKVFFGPTTSFEQVLDEATCNAMFQQWLASRKQLQAQRQLVADVMRDKKLN